MTLSSIPSPDIHPFALHNYTSTDFVRIKLVLRRTICSCSPMGWLHCTVQSAPQGYIQEMRHQCSTSSTCHIVQLQLSNSIPSIYNVSNATLNCLSKILPGTLTIMFAGPLQLQSQHVVILITNAGDGRRCHPYAQ
jgi:hypothetical protein